MAAGMNVSSDITTFVNSIFEDALFVARDNNLMQPLVTTFSDAQGLASRKLQAYGTATIRQINETDDLVSQTYAPTALTTLTPAEFGAQIFLTDLRMETDPFGRGMTRRANWAWRWPRASKTTSSAPSPV